MIQHLGSQMTEVEYKNKSIYDQLNAQGFRKLNKKTRLVLIRQATYV